MHKTLGMYMDIVNNEGLAVKRTLNLVIYSLSLAWVVMASLAWHLGDLTTVRLFKLCSVPIGVVIGCIAVNWILDGLEFQRSRGFEVKHEKQKRF